MNNRYRNMPTAELLDLIKEMEASDDLLIDHLIDEACEEIDQRQAEQEREA